MVLKNTVSNEKLQEKMIKAEIVDDDIITDEDLKFLDDDDKNDEIVRDLSKILKQVNDFAQYFHKKNQKRIKIGLWCIIIVPVFFLFLLFKMESSKAVYLTLWVISLFAISGYLITVSYIDYNLQEKLKKLSEKFADTDGKFNYDDSPLIESNLDSIIIAAKELKR